MSTSIKAVEPKLESTSSTCEVGDGISTVRDELAPLHPVMDHAPLRVLIAEDDCVPARLLEASLQKWGHEVILAHDGLTAWESLRADDAPKLAILDWMMPGLEGPEICRRSRALRRPVPTYIILLTGKDRPGDIVAGLESGADDYVTKPFDPAELRSRLGVGERMVRLQEMLSNRVKELESALGEVKQLKGLLPICAWCRHVRNDGNYWQTVEEYLGSATELQFTHGICPKCMAHVSQELL